MTGAVQGAGSHEWPLLGRQHELKVLLDAMSDPRCAGAMLLGPAGVGKTRLAREIGAEAARRALPAFAIRASRSAAAIPLAALSPLLTGLGLDHGQVDSPLQAVLAAIDEVQKAAKTHRVVIVVDDAQHLDEASAALLDQLVGRTGTYIVLTARTGAASEDELLLDLGTEEEIIRVHVGPLPEAEVRALVPLVLNGPVSDGTLLEIARACAGNVLFLRELINGALESGILAQRGGIWRLNGSLVESVRLRDLIDRRLQGLTVDEREALELVALAEPLPLSLLASLVPLPSIEALELRGLVDAASELPRGSPNEAARREPDIRLAHPLYGEVVRAHLSPVHRARLCRSLADAVETFELKTERDLLRLAVWRLDGGGQASPERTLAAARAAFRRDDYILAARLARVAWDVGQSHVAAILLVDSLGATGDTAEIEDILHEALRLAETDQQRTIIAVRLASSLFVWHGREDEADELLVAASREMTSETERRAIDAQRADQFLLRGNVGRAIELDAPLLAQSGDGPFAQASRDYGVALALAGRAEEAIGYTEAALSARQDLEDQEQLYSAAVFLVARSLALAEGGRLEEAISSARFGYTTCLERKNRDGQAWFSCVLGLALCTEGHLREADHLFREAALLFQEMNHPGRRWGLGGIALASGQLGDRDAALAAIAELDATPPTAMRMMDVHIGRGRAWAAVSAGDLVSARQLLDEATALGEEWGQFASAAAALHDRLRIHPDRAAARRLLEMQPRLDGKLMQARAAHAAAVLSNKAEDARLAAVAFEECGALLPAAECRMFEASLADAHGLPRQATAARRLADLLLEGCDPARTPALSSSQLSSQLSTREREVALLAADGMTSRDIADRLFVSPRTVDNHLQRVYTKLGVTSRAELSRRLESAPAS